MERITLIGAGSWGTALAIMLAEKGHKISLWCRRKDLAAQINALHENKQYLPGIKMPKEIFVTSSIASSIEGSNVIIFAVPSAFFRSVVNSFSSHISAESIIMHVTKGIEANTRETMSQILKEELGKTTIVSVMSGPNHAEEVALKLPTATVIASENKKVREQLCTAFSTSWFKPYPHDDITGVEVCGAVKNIIAIAIGVCDGLNLGDNAKGSILTLGLAEMGIISKKLGGKKATPYGLAGIGDLVATCFSQRSRNRHFGYMLAKGKSPEQICNEMHGMVAEGFKNTKAIHEICTANKINAPLISQTYKVLYCGMNLRKSVNQLLDKV